VRERLKFWLITIAALIGIGLTLALGRWQLSRAAQKEGLQAAIIAQSQRPVLDNVALTKAVINAASPLDSVHRTVKLRGTWVASKTVFLDNRQMNAKPGFYVVTPMMLENTAIAILVQRGWIGRNFNDRERLPDVPTTGETVEIHGRIAPSPPKLFELGEASAGRIRQNLVIEYFKAETGLPLLPVSILQSDVASDGLLRDWPVAAATAGKNYGYAFQWFGLSLLITLLYGWFQIGKRFFSKPIA
jgi:surfeit locus 1 family protein